MSMFELLIEHIKPAMEWLHTHPHFAYITTFFIALLESLPIIGLIVPGSFLLIGIGTLIGSGIIFPLQTILSAIFGAIAGDFLGFWVGHYYKDHMHRFWLFKRWPKLLQSGEAFFLRHGGKGVFLGRFIGPMRPITPTIAALMKMPFFHFVWVDVLSAILWAIAYIFPGIIVGGAASAELPPEVMPRFLLIIFLSIVILTIFYWIIRKLASSFLAIVHYYEQRIWAFIQRTPQLHIIKKLIYTPHFSEKEHQVELLFVFIFSLFSFLFITYQVVTHGFLTQDNNAINYFFRSLRTNLITNVVVVLSFLAEKRIIGILVIIFTVFFVAQRYYRIALFWLLNAFLIFGSTWLIKIGTHIPRPKDTQGILEHGWSYPSGHVALSVAIFSFLIILFSQHIPRIVRNYIYSLLFAFLILITFSRLYLNAHWLTDVLGGLFLGLTCMSFTALIYRHKTPHIKIKNLIMITCLSFLIWFSFSSIFILKNFTQSLINSQLTWPKSKMSFNEWWNQNDENSPPLYRSNRFGKPIQTINVQFVGDIALLQKKLLQSGWHILNENTFKTLFYRLTETSTSTTLPLLNQQYLGQIPLLSFYKTLNQKNIIIFRLWNSNIEIMPSKTILFAGTVNYYHAWSPRLLKKQKRPLKTAILASPLQMLLHDIQNKSNAIQPKIVQFKQYPPLNDKADKDWGGLVLLLESR